MRQTGFNKSRIQSSTQHFVALPMSDSLGHHTTLLKPRAVQPRWHKVFLHAAAERSSNFCRCQKIHGLKRQRLDAEAGQPSPTTKEMRGRDPFSLKYQRSQTRRDIIVISA